MLRLLVILMISTVATSAFAQKTEVASDSTLHSNDSILVKKNGKVIVIASYAKRFQPRKAILYAAVLPGSGQVYNKKYWKVPIVYGGFFLITSGVVYYNNAYAKYKTELFGLLESGSSTSSPSGLTEAQLRSIIDEARRQRDFFIILDGFWYVLQLVDAHVDAHLKEFDLNPQLKLSLQPSVQQNSMTGRMSGFSLTLKF